MEVGFTGTRAGMTVNQLRRFIVTLRDGPIGTLHHGDCVGADEQAELLARGLGYVTVAHPPTNPHLRAYTTSDITLDPADYLVRNRAIVDAADVMIACPDGPERLRSGTWATIRYARKVGKDLCVIGPDGSELA